MSVRGIGVVTSLLISLATGCGSEQEDRRDEIKPPVVTLRVGVAASLDPWMEAFARTYEIDRSNVRFEISPAGSNVITRQVLAGAPFDIILLASPELMDRVDSAGHILPGTRRIIGTNRLCLIVPHRGFAPKSLSDLASHKIRRIAIGSPGVPAGDYARESLERSQSGDYLADRFVYGSNVRQVLTWVEAGEVDCGFVYLSDTLHAENIRVAFLIDSALHSPIRYEAAALISGENTDVARRTVEDLRIRN